MVVVAYRNNIQPRESSSGNVNLDIAGRRRRCLFDQGHGVPDGPVTGIEKMREAARERGGECLSDDYVNANTKLKWRCAEGHE